MTYIELIFDMYFYFSFILRIKIYCYIVLRIIKIMFKLYLEQKL